MVGTDRATETVDGRADRCGPVGLLVALLVLSLAVPVAAAQPSAATASAIHDAAEAGLLQTDGPTASLTVSPDPAQPGESVTLDATESTAGENDDLAECAFDTDGDGTFETTSTACLVDRSYAEVGEYNLTVRVMTAADRTDTDSYVLQVADNQPPEPAIALDPAAPRAGETVGLSGGESTDSDGEVVQYEWSVGDESLTGETVETAIEEPGTYEVTLTVTDDDGASTTVGEAVEVEENRSPTAALTAAPADASVGETIELDATGSSDPDGTVVAYRWDLDGDGTVDRTTDSARTTVTAEGAGQLAVLVTVVDDLNATDTVTAEVTIATAIPQDRTPLDDAGDELDGGDGPSEDGNGVGPGLLGPLDPGVVPVVPDWLVALVLGVAIATAIAHRREPIQSRIESARERVKTGEFRRNAAKKTTGGVTKTIFKKVFRKLADGIEASGNLFGGTIERLGRAIKRGSKRLADALRALGG